jgi:NADH-ubiquinone oxidoreductase chain 1
MCILITIILLGGYEIISIIDFFNKFINFFVNNIFFIISIIHIYVSEISLVFNKFIVNILSNYNNYIYIYIKEDLINLINYLYISFFFNPFILSFLNIFIIGFKSCLLIFTFIWVRASYPRIRFDQLMSYCWTILLPIIIAIIIFIPCILYNKDIIPCIISLL